MRAMIHNGDYFDHVRNEFRTIRQDEEINILNNEIVSLKESLNVRGERINSLTKLCNDLYSANQKHMIDKSEKKQSLKNLIGYFYSRKRYVYKSI